MVQPVPCHTPSPSTAAETLTAAGLVELPRPARLALTGVASCHARSAAPVRDRLFAASAVAAASAEPAPTAAPSPRAATGAGYAKTVASAVSTVVQAAAKPKTTATSTKKKSTGALAFLDDKALSTSEKLMRLLVYLESKWQKDVEKRMKEIAATGAAKKSSSTSSSSSSSSGGLVGSVVKAAASFVPGAEGALALLQDASTRKLISQASGPVLAAGVSACGFPALAPLALKLGPTAVDALASATKPAKTTSTSSRTSGTSSSDMSPDAFEKIQLMELQRVVEHQKELFSMVSNMLRAESELRMTIIQNVR